MEGATKKHGLTSISNTKCKKKNNDDRGQTWMIPKRQMKNTRRACSPPRAPSHTPRCRPFHLQQPARTETVGANKKVRRGAQRDRPQTDAELSAGT